MFHSVIEELSYAVNSQSKLGMDNKEELMGNCRKQTFE
jgi:hypothetical protein